MKAVSFVLYSGEIFAFYIFNKIVYPCIPVRVFPCAVLSDLLLVYIVSYCHFIHIFHFIYTHIRTYTHTHIHTYTHTHIHTHTHTYTYTYI